MEVLRGKVRQLLKSEQEEQITGCLCDLGRMRGVKIERGRSSNSVDA